MHLPISKDYNMSFGVKAGLGNNTFLQDRAVVLNPTIDQPYQDYIATAGNRYIMDVGAGLYIYSKKAFFGIAADHLTKDFVSFGPTTANFNTQMHLNLTAGYKIPLNENLSLTPAFLVKFMNPAPVSFDVSAQLEFKEWLWAGVSYRNKDAVVAMAGLNISERFKLGYSYDYGISRMNKYSSGGHELILGIMLGR
jgi:type IX secretion system PorP/SprF family membrane protein